MKIALALIALVLGYKVFIEACKEKEGLKYLGQAIGIFVMIGALLLTVCGVVFCTMKYSGGYSKHCPTTSAIKAACPLASRAAQS